MSHPPLRDEVGAVSLDQLTKLVQCVDILLANHAKTLQAIELLKASVQSIIDSNFASAQASPDRGEKAAPVEPAKASAKSLQAEAPVKAAPAARTRNTPAVEPAPVPTPAPTPAPPAATAKPARRQSPGKPSISWIVGPPENLGWAYGNNARRLSARMPGFNHQIAIEDADIAIYFDVIVADRYPVKAKHSIVRVGGPRPLDRLYGDDPVRLREGLARFDAVIVLNLDLYRRIAPHHPRVVLIPNALDLTEWHPSRMRKGVQTEFTVGFAASANTAKEMQVKGGAIAVEAAKLAGVKLLRIQRGDGTQIPHERMLSDFYAHCRVLVHPVSAGREGSSNVIMEALACGLPVLTTPHAGLHSELLVDGRNALIREPDVKAFADALRSLKNDRKLRDALGLAGRQFAERNHDIRHAAEAYLRLIDEVRAAGRPPSRPSISFTPFWMPAADFGSSRLRALYPSEILKENGWDVTLGFKPEADVAVLTQSADNPIMEQLKADPKPFVIYDVCDRYFENPRNFKRPDGDVNSLTRFQELMERSDILTVPTRELKVEIAQRFPHKPVIYVPETIDYGISRQPVTPEKNRTVLWFGNPDRGNFETSLWMIERLMKKHRFKPLIVSRRSYFKRYPELYPHVVEWSANAMREAFEQAGLCVVSHSPEEQSKSPNRMITSIMHGVPTLVSGSRSCAEIMREAKMDFAVVSTPQELDRAMVKILDGDRRRPFVRRLQTHINANFGRAAIGAIYRSLLEDQTFPRSGEKLRVAFVSHNLVLGEGAPWSLFELAQGLQAAGHVESFAYSPGSGPLKQVYEQAGVPIEVFDATANHVVKVINRSYGQLRDHFKAWLAKNRIGVVVGNTAKSGALVHFAAEAGIPGMVIIRESFEPERRFADFGPEARFATEVGLGEAKEVVFVAKTSRSAWDDHPFFGRVSVIPNGINPDRFADTLTADRAELRQRLGLRPDGIIALVVGTINRRKGQEGIVQAFAGLPKEVRDRTQLVLLGALENSYLGEFRVMLKTLPQDVQDQILVVSATSDVGSYYRAADLQLMNSSNEAYPRSIVEGLLFGLPVISTTVFGVQEQVTHGETGFLYPFDAMDRWSEHFTRLVTDDALRARMSAEAARSFWKLTTHAEMLHSYKARLMQMHAAQTALKTEAQ